MIVTDEMVNRFLTWPLPSSVCADLIATRQGSGRTGTNLLSAIEARQMLEYLLIAEPASAAPDVAAIELLRQPYTAYKRIGELRKLHSEVAAILSWTTTSRFRWGQNGMVADPEGAYVWIESAHD